MITTPYCVLVIEDESDRAFMAELFTRYNRLMYDEIFQIVRNQWATEDILQSVLERLIDKIDELRKKDRDRLVNYIISACKNKAKNHLRDLGRHGEVPLDEYVDWSNIDINETEVDFRLIKEDELSSLARIWEKLDDRSRYLLEGRYILKKAPAEMAEELGVQIDSLRMALSRARKTALKLWEKEYKTEKSRD